MANARWALLSVTDKSNLPEFARGLISAGFKLLSTGGTYRLLQDCGIQVTDVSTFTGSPEIMDGRVKTLHPKIHAGILMDRTNPKHKLDAESMGAEAIDMVVVNLYQFAENAVAKKLAPKDAIEFIDVGGPTMLRAAAKNFANCCAVCDPADYVPLIDELKKKGGISLETRQNLAAKVFSLTAQYDQMISGCLNTEPTNSWSPQLSLRQTLRYGENPHQSAALYAQGNSGFAGAQILGGKELSYNNYLDLDAACQLARDLAPSSAVIIVKHTNPCGAAVALDEGEPLAQTFRRAFDCDPQSAFGGIIACNRPIDGDTASAIAEHFIECVAAPDFHSDALKLLGEKKNLRIVKLPDLTESARGQQVRSIFGAVLVQSADEIATAPDHGEVVTKTLPTSMQRRDLAFAMTVAKHVKSNAIVYAKDLALLAVGAGQMSRIDAARFAAEKARRDGRSLNGSVMASDAFFPFRDTVELAADLGVKAIIQPGGSKRDEESISACDQAEIAMIFTGVRHFRH